MTRKVRSVLIYSLIFSLVLIVILVLFQYNAVISKDVLVVNTSIFMGILTVFLNPSIVFFKESSNKGFVISYFVGMVLRILGSIVYVSVSVFSFSLNKKSFFIWFIIVYLIHVIFEISILLTTLRSDFQGKGKK